MEEKVLKNIFCQDFLHFFIRDIFIHLDPISLHNCRQVSKQWNFFIKNQIWGNQEGRKVMNKKLLNRFKRGNPTVQKLNLGHEFFCCKIDQKYLTVGSINGILASTPTKNGDIKVVRKLRCSTDPVNIDMNDRLIVAGSSGGKIAVWNRDDLDVTPIYTCTSFHGIVKGVKIVGDIIITATSEHVVSVHTHDNGKVWEKNNVTLAIGGINHIDADEHHILFATSDGLRLADMDKGENIKLTQINMDEGNLIHHCSLFYPQATYSPCDGGVKIVNIDTGELLRHLHDGVTVGKVALNKSMLALQDASHEGDIFIYDRNQLIDGKVMDKDLWSRRMEAEDRCLGNFYGYFSCFLDLSETSIIHFSKSDSMIVIKDFWLGDLDQDGNPLDDQ